MSGTLKKTVKKLIILLLSGLSLSCAHQAEKSAFDLFSENEYSGQQLERFVSDIKAKISALERYNQALKNYRRKYQALSDFEKSSRRDTDVNDKAAAKINEMIRDNDLKIKRYTMQIRVLERKLEQ